jgi:hypothetical protein
VYHQGGSEPWATELPDDVEDASLVGRLPDEATKIRRVKLAVGTRGSLDLTMELALFWFKRTLRCRCVLRPSGGAR